MTNCRGLSLVEMMVGLAVGLLVVLSVGTLYVKSKTVYRVSEAVARLQESGRFTLDLIGNDARMAGFVGCRGQAGSLYSTIAGTGYLYRVGQGVGGAHGTGAGFSPALDASISGLSPTPDATSDVLTVWTADPGGLPLTQAMASSADNPVVGANTVIGSGDIVVVSDCSASSAFQVTSSNPAADGILRHTATGTPGNASTDLRRAFGREASVYRITARTYYVAPSVYRPGRSALWRHCLPGCSGVTGTEEVSEGVETMAVLYGLDDDGDGAANRYLRADQVGAAWDKVVSLKLTLTLSTRDDNIALPATAGPDRRLRVPLTQVVTLRNRVP